MAALRRRLWEFGRPLWARGVQTPPQDPPPYPAVVESTEEFHFVERLLPPACVPPPPQHPSYPTPSGWTPPQVPPPSLPYHVGRSRMHNLPLYRRVTNGSRRITELRHIRGDIWGHQPPHFTAAQAAQGPTNLALNTSKGGRGIHSLSGQLFQHLTALTANNFPLRSYPNLPFLNFNLSLVPSANLLKALEKELREFVGQRVGKEPLTQVNEVTGTLRLKGHVDSEVRAWLLLKGF